jgi:ketopantoate hydroxymethyltransferase
VYGIQLDAVKAFIADVQEGRFPAEEHTFGMKAEAAAELRRQLGL